MKIRETMKMKACCRTGAVVLAVLLAVFFSVSVLAETGYVSDMLLLTMRSGPGDKYPVLKTLTSNTAVEILEKGETYYRVRTVDGDEGWVQHQYITDELPSTLVIAELKNRIQTLEAANNAFVQERSPLVESMEAIKKEYEQRVSALESSLDKAVRAKAELAADLDTLRQTHGQFLEKSKDTVAIIQGNQMLKQENLALVQELGELKKNKDDFLKASMIRWFLAGAGVLILGWIIGRSMGSSRRSSLL